LPASKSYISKGSP